MLCPFKLLLVILHVFLTIYSVPAFQYSGSPPCRLSWARSTNSPDQRVNGALESPVRRSKYLYITSSRARGGSSHHHPDEPSHPMKLLYCSHHGHNRKLNHHQLRYQMRMALETRRPGNDCNRRASKSAPFLTFKYKHYDPSHRIFLETIS